MIDLSWLDPRESASLFGPEGQHVPLTLQRVKGARILWLNRQAAMSDPAYAALGGQMDSYEKNLLDTCAYAVPVPGGQFDASDEIVAYADRYGGPCNGPNGGSGRAAVMGHYLVKGIGRTPLINAGADAAHASGGAYFEEAVRETIYCELVRAEYPHSAVPVLAIIDTGIEQDFGVKIERRVLVVRPCFLRPAHYSRATTFMSGNPTEGALDCGRVEHMFRETSERLGKREFVDRCNTLWLNWAAQLAYGFIHRLRHGSFTMANICLDGKMLDFGASSTVPSWANASIMVFGEKFDDIVPTLLSTLRPQSYYFGRYLDPALADPASLNELCERVESQFRTTIVIEMLRLAGVRRECAARAALDHHWWPLAYKLISTYQAEKLEMFDAVPRSHLPWDFDKVWHADVPPHLLPLRHALEDLVPVDERTLAAQRCALLASSRPGLFREGVRHEIYRKIDPSSTGQEPTRSDIEDLVVEYVAKNRRDSHVDLADAACVGFAVNNSMSYALFKHKDGALFAVDEHRPDICLAVDDLSPTSMYFLHAAREPFRGAIVVHAEPGVQP
jgi:hypothetical protein